MEYIRPPQDKLREMKYSFDRDRVRRQGYNAFNVKRGILLVLCEVCGEDYDQKRSNQKVCSEPSCKRELASRRYKKWYDQNKEGFNEERKVKRAGPTGDQRAFTDLTDEEQDNLITALIKAACMLAVEEQDIEWIEQCLPGAMASVGEHVDADLLIDMMENQHSPRGTRKWENVRTTISK